MNIDTDSSFNQIARGDWLGVPREAWIMLVLVSIGWAVSRQTIVGRNLTAVGRNPDAAHLAGIPVRRYVVGALAVTAAFAACAGILTAAKLSAGRPEVGAALLLPTFAAAFLGAAVSRDGAFNMPGAVLGALMLTTITNGLVIVSAPDWTYEVVTGVVLLLAVGLSRLVRRGAAPSERLDDSGRSDLMTPSGAPLATHPSVALDVDLVVGVALDAAQAVLGARACAYIALERSTAALADRATSDAFLPAARRAALEGAGAVFGTGRDGEAALRCHRVAVLGEPRGVLVVEHAADRLPGRVADAQAGALADSLGVMIARVLRSRPTQHAYDALSQIAAELHSPAQDGDAVLSLIVQKARELVDTDVAWMELVVDGELVPVVVRGARGGELLSARTGLDDGIGATALAEQRALVIADCRAPSVSGGIREALVAEGLVSLVCAPMSRDDEPVGALYVADRHRTPFADSDARLLSALAAQASIALANRTLYARLREHNELLESTFSVHHELTQASLTGVGVQGVVELLAQLVGYPIALTVDSGDVPLVRSSNAPSADVEESLHAVVSAGAERLGVLQVIGAETLAPLQRKAFEHGQTVLALELLREQAAREVEWRLSGELLDGLLECEGEPPAALRRRAEYLRVDLEQPHRALAFALADEVEADRLLAQVRGLLARRAPGNAMHALSGRRGCWVVLALPPALEHDAAALAEAVRGLDGERPGQGVRAGIGPLDHRLATSWQAATACVAFAERIGGPAGVTGYDELGPLRFVLDTPDPRHAVAIASEALERLIEHDRNGRSELLGTLRAYLETGGHQRETADRCHIATSTLKYRLAKIRDVLGRNPGEPDVQFELMLAFKLRDLLAATGGEAQDTRVPADSAD